MLAAARPCVPDIEHLWWVTNFAGFHTISYCRSSCQSLGIWQACVPLRPRYKGRCQRDLPNPLVVSNILLPCDRHHQALHVSISLSRQDRNSLDSPRAYSLAFYRRIFPVDPLRKMLLILSGLVACFTFTILLLSIFQWCVIHAYVFLTRTDDSVFLYINFGTIISLVIASTRTTIF